MSELMPCEKRTKPNPHYRSQTPTDPEHLIVLAQSWESAWCLWTYELLADVRSVLLTKPGKMADVKDALDDWATKRQQGGCKDLIKDLRKALDLPLHFEEGRGPVIGGTTKPPPSPFGGGRGGEG